MGVIKPDYSPDPNNLPADLVEERQWLANRKDKRRNRRRGTRLYASQRPATAFRPRKSPRIAAAILAPVQPRQSRPLDERPESNSSDEFRWRRPRRANGKRYAHKAAEPPEPRWRGNSIAQVIVDEVA